jgi:acetylornithine deacetylase/succinyl-diaminopimelate desuccinylase-like protein
MAYNRPIKKRLRIPMPDQLNQSINYSRSHKLAFEADLNSLLKLPSISTSPEHKHEIISTAEEVARLLVRTGLDHVKVMPTLGCPVVYADWLNAGPDAKTVLIYGHYDVQPADPLDLWETGPFDPTKRGDYIFARGSSDMKGQIVAVLSAIKSWIITGGCPVNLKFLIEGEEEIGSPNLKPFLQENKALLQSDFALNPDAGMVGAEIPTIVYSLRGVAFFELVIQGPDHDLHSGLFGGIVHNPAVALSELISKFHDGKGRVTLPGFYDNVRPVDPLEHEELSRLPMDESFYRNQTGVPEIWGEEEYLPIERIGARPTLEINGLLSGFTGKGTKTVIPSYALAKISCRLVADQDPESVYAQFSSFLELNAPKTVRYTLKYLGGGIACATDPKNPYTLALDQALESVWGVHPVYRREGGSIPVVADMQKILGIDSVLTGFGLPDDCIHSPNERLHLPTWYKGIESLIRFFYNLKTL